MEEVFDDEMQKVFEEAEDIIKTLLLKGVFLFFLRHPEGVMFSHLHDYRDELLKIYGRLSNNDDPHKMEDSIIVL